MSGAGNPTVCATAPAKINLTLEVTGRRPDGYHAVRTVMQAVTRREKVLVRRTENTPGVTLAIEGAALAPAPDNTACRAAAVFFERAGLPPCGLEIRLCKSVPMGAGLAGGSADAAAVLTALNALFEAGLTTAELCAAGARVGADVPFCVLGGAAVGTGTGTELTPCSPLPDCFLVIAKPPEGISTAEAYRRIDAAGAKSRHMGDPMLWALAKGDLHAAAAALSNAFEAATDLPAVADIRGRLRAAGALGCQMTGSGSAVFGIFEEEAAAARAAALLAADYEETFVCRPDTAGARTE